MSLPQELVDLIIDHLHDDLGTLKSCSLVSPSWRPSSQLHLHRQVTLQPKTLTTHPHFPNRQVLSFSERIATLLSTSQHLLPYIQTLVIKESDSSWLQRDSTLLTFLTTLTQFARLQAVQLHNIDWRVIPLDLQEGLFHVLSHSTLRDVALVDCYLPSRVPWTKFLGPETASVKLDRVKVYGSETNSGHNGQGNRPTSSGVNANGGRSIETLEIYGFGQSTSRLVSWITHPHDRHRLQHLKSLSLFCDRVSVDPLNKLIQICPSLEYLKFEPFLFRWDHRDAFPFPVFTENSSLHTLHFSGLYTDQLRWLTQFVTRLASPSVPPPPLIRSIHVDMSAQIPVLVSKSEALLAKIRLFDRALFPMTNSSVHSGGELKDVCIRLSVPRMVSSITGVVDGEGEEGNANITKVSLKTLDMEELERSLSVVKVEVVR